MLYVEDQEQDMASFQKLRNNKTFMSPLKRSLASNDSSLKVQEQRTYFTVTTSLYSHYFEERDAWGSMMRTGNEFRNATRHILKLSSIAQM